MTISVVLKAAKDLNKLGVLSTVSAENIPSEPDMYNHNAGKHI
jgi:hypothetical protein